MWKCQRCLVDVSDEISVCDCGNSMNENYSKDKSKFSMVILLVKSALAAIDAFIILSIIGLFIYTAFLR